MLYRGPKGVESSEKKTISIGAGLGPKISVGDLTIITALDVRHEALSVHGNKIIFILYYYYYYYY